MNSPRLVLAATAIVILLVAWLLRWDLQPAGVFGEQIPTMYLLDRWTGDIYWVTPQGTNRLEKK